MVVTAWEKSGRFDLEAVEAATRTAMLEAGADILKTLLEYEAPAKRKIDCGCGSQAEYIELRPKQIVTLVGQARVMRPYYLCRGCHQGQIPIDKELDVEGTVFSPGVRRIMSLVGSQTSFDNARQQIKELAGLDVTTKAVERVSEATGADIIEHDEARIEQTMSIAVDQGSVPEVPIFYVEMDASGVPVASTEIDPNKPGKQGDRQKTREAKLGCVFTQTSVDEAGRPVRDEASTTYVGAIETSEQFGRRIYAEAIRRGLDGARKVVIIGDGAPWIWILARLHFPGAIEILDLFHAREHLWKLAAKLFVCDEIGRKRWLNRFLKLLDNGRIPQLVAQLRAIAPSDDELRKAVNGEADYFERNAHRAQYPSFRRQNLFVGSGVIEAACKTVIGLRFKQSGMFWTVKGANSILALRCARLSNTFDDYWAARSLAA